MAKTIVRSEAAPAPVGPYSQAVKVGGWLYASGQIPLDPQTGQLVQGGIEHETRRVMDNLSAVLAAAGASFQQVVKVTVYLTDMQDFPAFNAVFAGYFPSDPPARATVAVAALPRGAHIEIDAVAFID